MSASKYRKPQKHTCYTLRCELDWTSNLSGMSWWIVVNKPFSQQQLWSNLSRVSCGHIIRDWIDGIFRNSERWWLKKRGSSFMVNIIYKQNAVHSVRTFSILRLNRWEWKSPQTWVLGWCNICRWLAAVSRYRDFCYSGCTYTPYLVYSHTVENVSDVQNWLDFRLPVTYVRIYGICYKWRDIIHLSGERNALIIEFYDHEVV